MNPEERSLLERLYKMTEENNVILKSIRRTYRISLGVKIIYWGIIAGLSVGAFYFIQPYINFMTGALSGGEKTGTDAGTNSVQGYIDSYKSLLK